MLSADHGDKTTSEKLEASLERVAPTTCEDGDSLSGHLGAMDDKSSVFKDTLRNAKGAMKGNMNLKQKSSKPSRYKKQFLRSVFQEWDKDGDGFIAKTELASVLVKVGIPASMLEMLFKEADRNSDGWIELDELCNWLYHSEIGSVMLSTASRSDPKRGLHTADLCW
mmetsp:Transcript_25998/g.47166  ORF Transcript_25998/g.47166 Transcript_25998/m.47166 type:complete len:167 (+) Transcript_25998:1-501(+)